MSGATTLEETVRKAIAEETKTTGTVYYQAECYPALRPHDVVVYNGYWDDTAVTSLTPGVEWQRIGLPRPFDYDEYVTALEFHLGFSKPESAKHLIHSINVCNAISLSMNVRMVWAVDEIDVDFYQFDPGEWKVWEGKFRMACEYSLITDPYWNQGPSKYVTEEESAAEAAAVAALLATDPGYGTRGENNVPDHVMLYG